MENAKEREGRLTAPDGRGQKPGSAATPISCSPQFDWSVSKRTVSALPLLITVGGRSVPEKAPSSGADASVPS